MAALQQQSDSWPEPEALRMRQDTAWQEIEAGQVRSSAAALRMARRFASACREADSSVTRSLLGVARYRLRGRWIWAHPGTRIRGLGNLETRGLLKIGVDFTDITHPDDRTWLRIDGRMAVGSRCKIGRGSRIHVGKRAMVTWGDGVWTNAGVLVHISHGLTIGDDCLLGWDSQLVDDNFHQVVYPGSPPEPTAKPIHIGNRVWVGNRVIIGRGVEIADGSVVAAGSVVTKAFLEPHSLIAGVPARVIRTGIEWY